MSTSGLYYFKSKASFTHLADATLAEDPHWPQSLQIPLPALSQTLGSTSFLSSLCARLSTMELLGVNQPNMITSPRAASPYFPLLSALSTGTYRRAQEQSAGLGTWKKNCLGRQKEVRRCHGWGEPPWLGREDAHIFVSLGAVQEWKHNY